MITQFDISTTKDALKKAKQAIDQALDLIERFDQATDDLEKEITKISNRPERDGPEIVSR